MLNKDGQRVSEGTHNNTKGGERYITCLRKVTIPKIRRNDK